MCLIIYKPKGVAWDYEAIANGFDYNPDGAGLMYQTAQGVRIERGFEDVELLIDTLIDAPQLEAQDVVVHFRWATHGEVDVANCHPFPVCKHIGDSMSIITKVGIAHNGIIPGMVAKSSESDTVQYIQGTLARVRNILFTKQIKNQLLATGSKFVIMDKRRVKMVGQFVEDGGIFYSNTSYLPWRKEEDVDGDMALVSDEYQQYGESVTSWWEGQEALWAKEDKENEYSDIML